MNGYRVLHFFHTHFVHGWSRSRLARAGCAVLVLIFVAFAPPFDVPRETLVTVSDGATVRDIAATLHEHRVIRSRLVFRTLAQVVGASERLQAGDYAFREPLSVTAVLARLYTGDFHLDAVRVRLLEGTTREQMATLLADRLPRFDREMFLRITEGREGYLFPDTYFFLPTVTADEVAVMLESTFEEKSASLAADFERSSYTRHEIVTMASLVEREAHDPDDRRLIAGVLWNRLEIGMPLQADATLFFLLGKPSSELTRDDLAFNSPYNTYLYVGLPPGPIANPGIDALDAALNPTTSDYLYYLADSGGNTHFARSFEEHKENRALYLD